MIDKTFPRRKRMRLMNYDYSLHGDYFVTIVTQGRISRFGKFKNDDLILNDIGRMIESCYLGLERENDEVDCLDYVVMPNHFHCIIRLLSDNIYLPDLIRMFKSKTSVLYIQGVKEHSWPALDQRLWQRGYYEHIIRCDRVFNYIRDYIFHNPERWYYDRINPLCCSEPDDINRKIKMLY